MCAFICVGACGSLVACGGGEEDDGTVTVIEYCIGDGGFGRAHADDIAAEFQKWVGDKSYAPGKTGVRVDVNVEATTNIASAKTNGYHVMNVSAKGPDVASNVRMGYLANIDDVIKDKWELVEGEYVSIEDKIPEYAVGAFKGDANAEGVREYYAAPGYSYAPGITIDENAFDKYGYFLAADDSGVDFYSPITQQTFYFCEPTGNNNTRCTNKSVGPDQKEGTQDDGMPANYMEFIALCEKIKDDNRYPFGAAGYRNYQGFFGQAVMSQLLGKQQLESWLKYDGGEVEVVTGLTNEPLFPGLDTAQAMIYKPKTAIVKLDEEHGYYAYQTAAEYYAIAMTQIINFNDWIAPNHKNSNYDQKTAMSDFMMSGFEPNIKQNLMFIEMDFWYNEAKIGNIPQYYERKVNHDGNTPRRLKWMSLPTVWEGYTDEQLTEDVKTRQVLFGCNANGLGVASWIEDDPEIFEACKDFVRFYCSDYQMNRWTAEIGIRKTANYKITQETLDKLPYFNKQLGELLNTNMDIVYAYSNSATMLNNADDYVVGYHGSPIEHIVDGTEWLCQKYFLNPPAGASVKKFFEAGIITPEMWLGKYYGKHAALSDAEKLALFAYQKDANGNDIKYTA